MANYLVAKCNTVTKSYELKSVEPSTKPYLKVSNSYLPLQSTSSTTNTGLYVKVDTKNYVPVESYTTTRSSSRTSLYSELIPTVGYRGSVYSTLSCITRHYSYIWFTYSGSLKSSKSYTVKFGFLKAGGVYGASIKLNSFNYGCEFTQTTKTSRISTNTCYNITKYRPSFMQQYKMQYCLNI